MKLEVKGENPIAVTFGHAGNIEKIFCGTHCWNGYPGGLTVVDDLRGRIFQAADAENIVIEESSASLVFEKRWGDSEFVLHEIWTAFDDCLSWRVEVRLKPGFQERSIQIKQLFPYPYPATKLHVWSANERFPCQMEELGGLHLYYGDACYGTVIPAISIYDKAKNTGITLSKPFGLKTARLAFHFKDYHSDGLEAETSCLYLSKVKPAETELLIRAHEGCWRPGLGWLYNKYPEYFDPPNPHVHELEGGFMLTNPYTEDSFIKEVGKYNVKWAEIHNHFPVYGNYAPDEKEWDSVIAHDYPELPPANAKLSRDKINRHIRSLHDNHIKGLLYFQCTGDAYIPYAEKKFPDAIARDSIGNIIPTWKECCFVNAAPGTSFHTHINGQIDKFIADYPEIDGVFLDQACYQTIDTAHQDGITASNNKPVAMFGYSYTETLQKLSDILHAQGKIIWGNGPFDIEVQRDIDGIMSEGTSRLSETYKYLCLTKPLLVHTYPDTPEKVETMFRYCLLTGASYSIGASSKLPVPTPITPEIRELFDSYIPLVEKLFGRTWLLEPNPLEIPPGFQANIFKGKDGCSVIVTLIRINSGLLEEKNIHRENIEIKVKVKDTGRFSEASIMTTRSKIPEKVEMIKNDKAISISINEPTTASVIIIR